MHKHRHGTLYIGLHYRLFRLRRTIPLRILFIIINTSKFDKASLSVIEMTGWLGFLFPPTITTSKRREFISFTMFFLFRCGSVQAEEARGLSGVVGANESRLYRSKI